jgi:hypothetical protein
MFGGKLLIASINNMIAKKCIVQRKYSQAPAPIKSFQVTGGFGLPLPLPHQNARDKEAGEHEEQLYANPTKIEQKVVEEHNKQRCNAPQSIESGNVHGCSNSYCWRTLGMAFAGE